MRIPESKNLKYDKLPWMGVGEGYEPLAPRVCLLESFNRANDRLDLYFKNGSRAVIKAKNIEGGKEIDLIENKLNDFLEKSYEEILDTDF